MILGSRINWSMHGAGLLACVIMTLVGGFLIVRPPLVAAAQEEGHRAEMMRLTAEASGLSERRVELERQLLSATELEGLFFVLMPANQRNTRLAELNLLAEGSGVSVAEIGVASTSEAGDLELVGIRLIGVGPYPAVVRMLHRLNESIPDMAVRGFDMQGDPGDRAYTRVSLDLVWFAKSDTAGAP